VADWKNSRLAFERELFFVYSGRDIWRCHLSNNVNQAMLPINWREDRSRQVFRPADLARVMSSFQIILHRSETHPVRIEEDIEQPNGGEENDQQGCGLESYPPKTEC
jgi:hypothetical protein